MTKLVNTQSIQYGLRHSKLTNREINKSSRKLASGSRINSASDDAAGLGISNKLNASNISKQQAQRNANDGISILQVMGGSLETISSMMIRLRELTVASATDTNSDNEREIMQLESGQIINEIRRISQTTKYNGKKLFDGGEKKIDIQVDANSTNNDRFSIDISDLAQSPYALGISDVRIDTKLRAQLSMAKLDHAIGEVQQSRAKIGSLQSRLGSTINKLSTDYEMGKKTQSKIKDLDYAEETAKNVKNSFVQKAQTATMHQINSSGASFLKLFD